MAESRRFTLDDLERWAAEGLITGDQLARIRLRLGPRRSLDGLSVAYYAGGTTILAAYSLFIGLRWEQLGPLGQASASLFTLAVLATLGPVFRRRGYRRAGNALVLAATVVVPLAVYSVERLLGLWPSAGVPPHYESFFRLIHPAWVAIEVVTIAAALAGLALARFAPIAMVISVAVVFLALDGTTLLAPDADWAGVDARAWIATAAAFAGILVGAAASVRGAGSYTIAIWIVALPVFLSGLNVIVARPDAVRELGAAALGAAICAMAAFVQAKGRMVASLWLYVLGTLILFGYLGRLALREEGAAGLLYVGIAIAAVVASVWLQRRVVLLAGAIGCYSYVSYLAFKVFADSLGFTFALASVGLLIVLSAVAYERWMRRWLGSRVPRLSHAAGPNVRST